MQLFRMTEEKAYDVDQFVAFIASLFEKIAKIFKDLMAKLGINK